MTTEATQGPHPATPQEMDTSDVREIYRSLGNLERGQAEIKEGSTDKINGLIAKTNAAAGSSLR